MPIPHNFVYRRKNGVSITWGRVKRCMKLSETKQFYFIQMWICTFFKAEKTLYINGHISTLFFLTVDKRDRMIT